MAGKASIALFGKGYVRYRMSGMRFPDGGVIALERGGLDIRENFSGFNPLGRVPRPYRGTFCRGEKNYAGSNKIYRFCLFDNNFNFIFA